MGQAEVIKFLKKAKKWSDVKQIAKGLNAERSAVGRSLRVLSKYEEILKKPCKNSPKFVYKIK